MSAKLTAVSLLAACVFNGYTASHYESQRRRCQPKDQRQKQNELSAVVCGIAFLLYVWMLCCSSATQAEHVRYLDWFITVPLLVVEMSSLYGHDRSPILASASAASMVLFGFLSTRCAYPASRARRVGLYTIGFAFYAATLVLFFGSKKTRRKSENASEPFANRSDTRDNNNGQPQQHQQQQLNRVIVVVLFGVWALYGAAYWLHVEQRYTLYNVLDLVCKSLLAFYIGFA